jgi:anti-sigma B factor antagonist
MGDIYWENRLYQEEIEKARPGQTHGWVGRHPQRKVDLMSAWILRFADTKITIGVRRPVMALHVTNDGEESELEVLEAGGEEHPGLRDLVRGQIEKGRPLLILDLGSVERIDSNGIGEIVAVWQHAKNSGGELVLAGLKPRIREIMEIIALDSVIPVFDTVIDAANHLARSGG